MLRIVPIENIDAGAQEFRNSTERSYNNVLEYMFGCQAQWGQTHIWFDGAIFGCDVDGGDTGTDTIARRVLWLEIIQRLGLAQSFPVVLLIEFVLLEQIGQKDAGFRRNQRSKQWVCDIRIRHKWVQFTEISAEVVRRRTKIYI